MALALAMAMAMAMAMVTIAIVAIVANLASSKSNMSSPIGNANTGTFCGKSLG